MLPMRIVGEASLRDQGSGSVADFVLKFIFLFVAVRYRSPPFAIDS
jgi:hypothetical protein